MNYKEEKEQLEKLWWKTAECFQQCHYLSAVAAISYERDKPARKRNAKTSEFIADFDNMIAKTFGKPEFEYLQAAYDYLLLGLIATDAELHIPLKEPLQAPPLADRAKVIAMAGKAIRRYGLEPSLYFRTMKRRAPR
jgi:hypothetical protein